MKRVVGIDFSLTCVGVAVLVQASTTTKIVTETFRSKGARKDDLSARHRRLTELGKEIIHAATPCDLAVIEGMFTGSVGGSTHDRSAGWWFVVGGLLRREVPVAVISPSSLKLAIAGSGRADKAAVAVALERLWPGLDVSSSDVSDAAGLAHLGAVWLGMDVPTLERHKQVKGEWPSEMISS